jgi:ATP/maltotriose-dependent transcriptional regulator MalT
LTSSRFVGRQSQLAELELACREALDGSPRLILVSGDSGVGKTRLLAEAGRTFAGTRTLHGECVEQGELELPYAPLLGALRPLVREQDPVLGELSAGSRANLATLLPSLGAPATVTSSAVADGQVRLFESLVELLHLLSTHRPLVIVLEDMHWADRSTRAFVSFLARNLTDERIMLLLSFRSDELHRRHPLRPLLAELSRLDCCRRLELRPFDRGELAEVLADILGSEPAESLLERLLARTDGNPLYVEELLAAALDGRGSTPQNLRDAFMLRIERLSDDAGTAARAVSVGRALDEPAIERVSGVAGPALREALRDAVAEHILVAQPDGRLRFRHALLREVVYDDLLPGERGAMHLELARMLEEAGPSTCADDEAERVAAIASHYAAGGDQSQALRATVRAAREAGRVHAYGEMADLYDRALELWPLVSDAPALAGVEQITDLFESAARAHALDGDQRHAIMFIERGLQQLDPETDPVRYGRLLVRRGRSRWRLNQAQAAMEDNERALELLPEEPNPERARLLSWTARMQSLRGHYREAIDIGEQALSMAVEFSLPMMIGESLNTLGMARFALGDAEIGEELLRQAIKLAREQDDLDDLGTAYSNLSEFLSLTGRTREGLETIESGLEEVRLRIGRGYNWMLLMRSTIAFEAGDWELARSHDGPSLAALEGVLLIFRLLCDAELALGAGDTDLAVARLEAAEPLVRVTGEAQWHGLYGSLHGELLRRSGDLEGAQRAVAAALDELEVCTDDVMRIARVTAVGLSVEADRAQRARDLREAGDERDATTRAQIHVDRLAAAAEEGGPVERAWLTTGRAEHARATAGNDATLWHAAATAWQAIDRPYCAATMRWREAEAQTEADDRDSAAATAEAALAVASDLGAGWLADELRGLAARARLSLVAGPLASDGADAGSATPDLDEAPFGLTPRELQVLGLIAEGATNRQIGAALYMAEKTASVHVSRILAKLDVQSRTQAAAVAHRLRLA